jgi:hypothetical protein
MTIQQMEESLLFDNVEFKNYLSTIVNQSLEDIVGCPNMGPFIYYMTCRGFTYNPTEVLDLDFDEDEDEQGYYILFRDSSYFACQIQDAGGLGSIDSEANPINDTIIKLLHSAEIDLYMMCRFLRIPKNGHLLTMPAFKRMLKRGYVNPLPIDVKVINRYNLFASFTPFTVQLLQRLINNNITEILTPAKFATYTDDYTKVLENLLIKCNGDVVQLQTRLGMTVPPFMVTQEEIETYILNNFIDHIEYLRRPSNHQQYSVIEMSDEEICRDMGGYVGYGSRQNLIDIYTYFAEGHHLFFVPYERKCINEYTQIGDNTSDPTIFIIALGNKNTYTCYTLEDLLGNFQPRGENGDIYDFTIFEHDSLVPTKLEKETITRLKYLLKIYSLSTIPEPIRTQAQDVLNAIILIEAKYRQVNEQERQYVITFKVFDPEHQKLIIDWVREAFYIGMYMRQWEGPGHAFPLTHHQTKLRMLRDNKHVKITEKDKDKFTRDELDDQLAPLISHTQQIEQKLPSQVLDFLMNLPMIDYRNDAYLTLENSPIKLTWRGVCSGEMCIRQWSRRIVITMSRYLLLFGAESISGFDVASVEEVT